MTVVVNAVLRTIGVHKASKSIQHWKVQNVCLHSSKIGELNTVKLYIDDDSLPSLMVRNTASP